MEISGEAEPKRACSDCISESTYLSKTEIGTPYHHWHKHPYYHRSGSPKEAAIALGIVKVHNPIQEEEEI